jgi:hypothetical protein
MPYRARWFRKALAETRAYWTPTRTALAVSGPIIAAVFWRFWEPWNGWWPLMQVAIISVAGSFAAWGIAFFIGLLVAPAKLAAEAEMEHGKQTSLIEIKARSTETALEKSLARVADLEAALAAKHPIDEHKESCVREAFGKLDAEDIRFLQWLLITGRANTSTVQGQRFFMQVNLNGRAGVHLVTEEPVRSSNGTEIDSYSQINPEMKDALRNVLYPPRPVTPPPV